jgi:hypothetical protein
MNNETPFFECWECTNIICCPHPDVSDDLLGRPIPPENCPKPEKIDLKEPKKHD